MIGFMAWNENCFYFCTEIKTRKDEL